VETKSNKFSQKGYLIYLKEAYFKSFVELRKSREIENTWAEILRKISHIVAHACVFSLSRVQLFEAPWTAARQAPLSMSLPRQEYWSGLPFPTSEDLPNPGREPLFPESPALSHLGSPTIYLQYLNLKYYFSLNDK